MECWKIVSRQTKPLLLPQQAFNVSQETAAEQVFVGLGLLLTMVMAQVKVACSVSVPLLFIPSRWH